MSFQKAKECFEENLSFINSQQQPKEHNLNVGLLQLTQALQSENSSLRNELSQIRQLLQQQAMR